MGTKWKGPHKWKCLQCLWEGLREAMTEDGRCPKCGKKDWQAIVAAAAEQEKNGELYR